MRYSYKRIGCYIRFQCVFQSQVQRDPRDNDVINEYHEMSKATSIIHNLEPKGKEIGNCIFLICKMPTLFVFHH